MGTLTPIGVQAEVTWLDHRLRDLMCRVGWKGQPEARPAEEAAVGIQGTGSFLCTLAVCDPEPWMWVLTLTTV